MAAKTWRALPTTRPPIPPATDPTSQPPPTKTANSAWDEASKASIPPSIADTGPKLRTLSRARISSRLEKPAPAAATPTAPAPSEPARSSGRPRFPPGCPAHLRPGWQTRRQAQGAFLTGDRTAVPSGVVTTSPFRSAGRNFHGSGILSAPRIGMVGIGISSTVRIEPS